MRKATTHEEPSVVVHEVIKPVIQEIREIIVPMRKVIQRIEPVQEERKTVVAHKGELEDKYPAKDDRQGELQEDKGPQEVGGALAGLTLAQIFSQMQKSS